MSDYIWIDTARKLQTAKKEIGSSSLIGIDTEYDSFRYFRERLCLIQIKTDNRTYLFDPLDHLDITFLGFCFSDPAIPKIVHAADNDIRLLKRDYGFEFMNLFDTQKAASILGYKHLSLASVVQQALGIELQKAKRIQRSQWDIRPLTNAQKEYAAQDTEHLFALYKLFRQELAARGLDEHAAKAFRDIAAVNWSEKVYDPCGFFKIQGFEDLKRQQKERFINLYEWRFQKAKATNTAVFMVLSDQNLIDLSGLRGHSLDDLREQGRLSEGRIQKYGEELVRILKAPHKADYPIARQIKRRSRI